MKIFSFEYLFPVKNKIAILDSPGSSLIKNALKQKKLPIISTRKNTKINIQSDNFELLESQIEELKIAIKDLSEEDFLKRAEKQSSTNAGQVTGSTNLKVRSTNLRNHVHRSG